LHQNDSGDGRSDRHRRVHGNAKLAVIGVGAAGVNVSNLGNGQKGKQSDTQNRYNRQKTLPAGMLPAEECHQCCQP
jgi:hypothetical protein